MAYMCDLGSGQHVYIDNLDDQTRVTLASAGPGQQQNQQISAETGAWRMPPTVLRGPVGLVVRVEAARGQFFFQMQGSSLRLVNDAPGLSGADVLSLQQVADQSGPGLAPMRPMEPMRMGDMEMRMGDMEMRMGNRRMQIDNAAGPASNRRFCTHCGAPAGAQARFCGSCGHRLDTDTP